LATEPSAWADKASALPRQLQDDCRLPPLQKSGAIIFECHVVHPMRQSVENASTYATGIDFPVAALPLPQHLDLRGR
jgi:hypothetical protein